MLPDSGGRARGRRDNGLTASSFTSVGDVDPRVGAHLLDVLALDGIAAYLQPTVDHDSVTRAVSLPGHPTDRLYVDRHRTVDARALVAAEAEAAGRGSGMVSAISEAAVPQPPPDPPDHALGDDDAWEGIMASYARESSLPVPPWPVDEDLEPRPAAEPAAEADPAAEWGVPDEAAAAAEESAEEDEEGYIPPPPPPLPRISRQTAGGLLLIAGGLSVLVLGSRLLGLDRVVAFRIGLVSVIVGVGYLIWRMRDDVPDEDRPDDGAVV